MKGSTFGSAAAHCLGLVAALAIASTASAQTLEADTDRGIEAGVAEDIILGAEPPRVFFGLGLGPTFTINDEAGFRLEEWVGYRFATASFGGSTGVHFFGAALLQQTFGPIYIFNFGGRIGADFIPFSAPGLELSITPMLGAGIAALGFEGQRVHGSDIEGGVMLEAAGQVELGLLNRTLGIWFRPIGINYYARDGAFTSYDMLAGVNVRL